MLTTMQLLAIISEGEGCRAEFKRDLPSRIRSTGEEVCAFANASGGIVCVGVRDDNVVGGASLDNGRRSALQGILNEITPAISCELYPVDVEGKTVWIIAVPSGKRKPYFFTGSVYFREGATRRKIVSAEEVRIMFQEGNRIYLENIPCPSIAWKEVLDRENLRQFRSLCHGSDEIDDTSLLTNLDVLDDDGSLQAAGVLFFTKKPERLFFQAMIRCVLFKGVDRVKSLGDKQFGGPV